MEHTSMEMFSTEFKDLMEALLKAKDEFLPIAKSGYNSHFKSHYAKYEDYERACGPALRKYGVTWGHIPWIYEGQFVELTIFTHIKTGQWMKGMIPISPTKQDSQGVGSYMTYMERYALKGMLGVSGEEDDDGNYDSIKTGPSIFKDQVQELQELIKGSAVPKTCYQNILSFNKITDLNELPASSYNSVKSYIKNFRVTP